MGDLTSPGATAPRDIATDDTGAFALVGGDLSFTAGPAAVKQAIDLALGLFLGEWFLDTEAGVDWWAVLGQKFNDSRARMLIRKALLAVPGVASVPALTTAFDPTTRQLSIAWSVTTDYGPLAGSTEVPTP